MWHTAHKLGTPGGACALPLPRRPQTRAGRRPRCLTRAMASAQHVRRAWPEAGAGACSAGSRPDPRATRARSCVVVRLPPPRVAGWHEAGQWRGCGSIQARPTRIPHPCVRSHVVVHPEREVGHHDARVRLADGPVLHERGHRGAVAELEVALRRGQRYACARAMRSGKRQARFRAATAGEETGERARANSRQGPRAAAPRINCARGAGAWRAQPERFRRVAVGAEAQLTLPPRPTNSCMGPPRPLRGARAQRARRAALPVTPSKTPNASAHPTTRHSWLALRPGAGSPPRSRWAPCGHPPQNVTDAAIELARAPQGLPPRPRRAGQHSLWRPSSRLSAAAPR